MAKVFQITCPECQTILKSQAGIEVGRQLTCPKCKARFTVRAVASKADVEDDFEVEDEEEETPKAKKPVKPVARPARGDDEDDRPKAKKRRDADDEDEDDRPRKKKRRDEDEEVEAEEGLYGRLKKNIYFRIGLMVVLQAIAGVLGYFLYEKRKKAAKDEDAARPMWLERVSANTNLAPRSPVS